MLEIELANEEATVQLGAALASAIDPGSIVYLEGDLGAGKTTFARGLIQSLGHTGAVKSPTYTLVEPYELDGLTLYHFDLYRLGDPEELEFMGIRDYFDGTSMALVEWPACGQGFLPPADLVVTIEVRGEGRLVKIHAQGSNGVEYLRRLRASGE